MKPLTAVSQEQRKAAVVAWASNNWMRLESQMQEDLTKEARLRAAYYGPLGQDRAAIEQSAAHTTS